MRYRTGVHAHLTICFLSTLKMLRWLRFVVILLLRGCVTIKFNHMGGFNDIWTLTHLPMDLKCTMLSWGSVNAWDRGCQRPAPLVFIDDVPSDGCSSLNTEVYRTAQIPAKCITVAGRSYWLYVITVRGFHCQIMEWSWHNLDFRWVAIHLLKSKWKGRKM